MRRLVPILLALLALTARAQAPRSTPGPAAGLAPGTPSAADGAFGLSDSTQVSLLTMMPGEQAYSLFGHSAIRIRDAAAGLDRTYNFGTFDFDQPYFVLRFLRGSLDYQLATAPYEWVLEDYRMQGRPIIEQTLALGPATAHALYDVLETNALPENRSYRYDFFFDNCSTRLLGAIDSALARTAPGAASRVTLPPKESRVTFRELIFPYVRGNPPVHLGTDLALGIPTDDVASPREETFLPLELAAQLDRATVGGRPLVARRDTVFWLPEAGLPEEAFPWPLLLGWILFAGTAIWTALSWTKGPDARLLDALLFGTVGLAGTILLLLWLATTHTVTGPNLNVLWAWPTHLIAAFAIARRRTGTFWAAYFGLTVVVTAATAAFWAGLPQVLPAAALPIALVLVLRGAVRAAATFAPHRFRPTPRPSSRPATPARRTAATP